MHAFDLQQQVACGLFFGLHFLKQLPAFGKNGRAAGSRQLACFWPVNGLMMAGIWPAYGSQRWAAKACI
jgi:hypothetical protein